MIELFKESEEFNRYSTGWLDNLPSLAGSAIFDAPETCALVSVDMVKGFCSVGPLASPRVAAIVPAVADLFRLAASAGVRALALLQDTHEPDAKEFEAWPVHCVRGTVESETVDELKALPFFNAINVFEKNSIDSAAFTGLDTWVAARPALSTFVVVGDCTDLCVYELAMHFKTQANATQMDRRVIVPANCVDTYDLPTAEALKLHAAPHPADLLHAVFLYHMALNGVEVVRSIH